MTGTRPWTIGYRKITELLPRTACGGTHSCRRLEGTVVLTHAGKLLAPEMTLKDPAQLLDVS
jgi:hypothetical protein